MFWDTHAHINMLEDPSATVRSFEENGIWGCICPAVDYESSLASIALAAQFPLIVGSAIGIHPNHHEDNHHWDDYIHLAETNKLWAIGETGLDYYRDHISPHIQKNRFIQHIELAKAHQLPLIIHMRQAADDILDLLSIHAQGMTCILHSFTESPLVAKQALELGCYISISGIVTFKNAQSLRDTVSEIPLNRLLIETDTPYLAPEPFRGKTNHPMHVRQVADTIAKIHQLPLETVAHTLFDNTCSVFTNIPHTENTHE